MTKTTIAISCRSKVKLYLGKLQNISVRKNQLSLDYADCEVLQKHYIDLLKAELPEEDKQEEKEKQTSNT
jgi:hypothetical protein